jgi:outer membrane immunogenic protein
MKTLSLGVTVAAALGFVAGPVSAADIPVKAAPPLMPALYNWSGVYVGVEGGAVMGQRTQWFEQSATDIVLPACNPCKVPVPAPGPTVTNSGDPVDVGHPLHGGFVGGEAGFNWQSGRWVFGIEGDGNWAELEEALTCDPFDGAGFTCGSRIRSFWTARGRIGYALGPTGSFLAYVTAGGVWARQSARIGTLTAPFVTFEQWKDTAGWTAGIGAEYGITPWLSVKGEVLFVDLAGKNYDLAGCTLSECEPVHVQHNFVMARMGLNWRFNWGKGKGPAPVVARY